MRATQKELSRDISILTSVDSDKPVRPPFKLRNSKRYAQAGLSICWSHIPHCWNLVSRLN